MYNVKIIYVDESLAFSQHDWNKWDQAYWWCRDNLGLSEKANWYNDPREGCYCFTRREDAVAFKLRFGL